MALASASADPDADDEDIDEEHDISIPGVIFSYLFHAVLSLITGSFGFAVKTVRKMLGMQDMDTVDHATGLSTRQKLAIRESWAIVSTDVKGNGVKFLLKFFDEFPKDKTYFTVFDGLSNEELKTNAKMRAHATMVMNALSSIVDNLDDPGSLIIFLRKNAQQHHERSIGVLQYKHLFETFSRFMSEALGSKYPPFTSNSWVKALEVVVSILDTELTALADT